MTTAKTIIDSVVDSAMEASSDKPDKVTKHGTKLWLKNGQLHRVDGPAEVCRNGTVCWFMNGQLHREDGPAVISWKGDMQWYKHGKRHRLNGPAMEYSEGHKARHRGRDNFHLRDEDGGVPVCGPYGPRYFVDDRQFTEDEFYRYVDQETGEVLVPAGKTLTYDIINGRNWRRDMNTR